MTHVAAPSAVSVRPVTLAAPDALVQRVTTAHLRRALGLGDDPRALGRLESR